MGNDPECFKITRSKIRKCAMGSIPWCHPFGCFFKNQKSTSCLVPTRQDWKKSTNRLNFRKAPGGCEQAQDIRKQQLFLKCHSHACGRQPLLGVFRVFVFFVSLSLSLPQVENHPTTQPQLRCHFFRGFPQPLKLTPTLAQPISIFV